MNTIRTKPVLLIGLTTSVVLALAGVLLALGMTQETHSTPRREQGSEVDFPTFNQEAKQPDPGVATNVESPGKPSKPVLVDPKSPVPHGKYYELDTTEARLGYLDSLVTGDEPSASKFLWDMILNRQSSSVSIRALEVALKIAANREKPEDLATVFSRAFEAPASEIRRRALALVETYPEPLIVPYLGEIIDLPREEAPLALIALARIGNYQARDKLLEVAKNAKAAKDLRIRAIILVGASKDKFARSTLEDIAREEDEELRKAAEQALRELSK